MADPRKRRVPTRALQRKPAPVPRRAQRAPVPRKAEPAPRAQPLPPPTYTPRSMTLAELTREILALHARTNRNDTEGRVATGALLAEMQARLGPGSWLEWLEGAVPFTPRTAQTYIELHRWREANPAVYPLLAPLGASKLYLLSRLVPVQLGRLLRRKLHLVPGTSTKRTLEALKVPELVLVIAAFLGTLPPPSPPATKALHNYRRRVHALARATHALTAYGTLPREALHDLHDALLQTAAELAEAFALEG